jgi:hypothetical protein
MSLTLSRRPLFISPRIKNGLINLPVLVHKKLYSTALQPTPCLVCQESLSSLSADQYNQHLFVSVRLQFGRVTQARKTTLKSSS